MPFLNEFLNYVLEDRIKIDRKKSCRFKAWMEFVRPISMKLKTSSNEGLLLKVFSYSLMWLSKPCSGHYVTTQVCTLISWGFEHLRWCGSLEDCTPCKNTVYLLDHIFHRYSQSLIAVTPFKYKKGFRWLHSHHCNIRNILNEQISERNFRDPSNGKENQGN